MRADMSKVIVERPRPGSDRHVARRFRRLDGLTILSAKRRKEVDHIQLGVRVAGLDPDRHRDLRVVVARRYWKLVDQYPHGSVHDRLPGQTVVVEKLGIVLRVRLKTSTRITKLSQHEADGGEFQEREGVAVAIFPVFRETAATIEPGNRAFDDPTLG